VAAIGRYWHWDAPAATAKIGALPSQIAVR